MVNGQLDSKESWRRSVAESYIDHQPLFHALDTFSGMPDNDERNITFSSGTFYATQDEVKTSCAKKGLNEETGLRFYRGLFYDTADKLRENMTGRKAAIINIDCDLYCSAKESLEISEEFIQVGTVLLFDDYDCFNANNNKGERKAFAEFSSQSRFQFEPWHPYKYAGQSFLCVDEQF